MKDCEKLEMHNLESRKAYLEKQNILIQKKLKTPEPSILGSSALSQDISLNSLSLKTESEDPKENAFQNFSSRSRKPSELLYRCITSRVSEKDQKILKLMALRREAKMEESELAFLARNIWEEERLQLAKKAEMNKAFLMESIAKKKQVEELENTIRRNNRNENLKQEKMILEMKISEKHERVERRQKELCLRKKYKPEISPSKYQLLFHQELKKQKQEEEKMEKALHIQQFEVKERRLDEKLRSILMERCRKLREERLKQDLKYQAAKNARDEMNKRREEERIQQMRFSERNQLLRKERVSWANEWKRRIISEKNEREKRQHAITYNKVKEEEKERLNRIRRKIQAKEVKAKVFRKKWEEAVSRSRTSARTAAELRQKIRLSYNL